MSDCDQCEMLLSRTKSLIDVLLEKNWQDIYASAKDAGETVATLKLEINPAMNRFDVTIEYVRPIRDTRGALIDDGQAKLPGM